MLSSCLFLDFCFFEFSMSWLWILLMLCDDVYMSRLSLYIQCAHPHTNNKTLWWFYLYVGMVNTSESTDRDCFEATRRRGQTHDRPSNEIILSEPSTLTNTNQNTRTGEWWLVNAYVPMLLSVPPDWTANHGRSPAVSRLLTSRQRYNNITTTSQQHHNFVTTTLQQRYNDVTTSVTPTS